MAARLSYRRLEVEAADELRALGLVVGGMVERVGHAHRLGPAGLAL